MPSDEPSIFKFKWVCADSPNLALLNKSATPAEDQLTYTQMSVENKSLGETVTAIALAGLLKSPTVATINAERALTGAGNKIRLGNLSRSKKLRYQAAPNAVLIPTFLTKEVVLEGDMALGELLKTFSAKIVERESEYAT